MNEKFANWASILTVPMLMALAGWVHLEVNGSEAHADAGTAALRQEMTATYETQLAHATDIAPIKEDNQKLWEGEKELVTGENEIKVSLQKVADAVDQGNQKRNN